MNIKNLIKSFLELTKKVEDIQSIDLRAEHIDYKDNKTVKDELDTINNSPRIVYSFEEPTEKFEGMIWVQPEQPEK